MASLKSVAGSYYVISSNRWLLVHMREACSVGLASYPGPCAERSVCGPGYEASVGLSVTKRCRAVQLQLYTPNHLLWNTQ